MGIDIGTSIRRLQVEPRALLLHLCLPLPRQRVLALAARPADALVHPAQLERAPRLFKKLGTRQLGLILSHFCVSGVIRFSLSRSVHCPWVLVGRVLVLFAWGSVRNVYDVAPAHMFASHSRLPGGSGPILGTRLAVDKVGGGLATYAPVHLFVVRVLVRGVLHDRQAPLRGRESGEIDGWCSAARGRRSLAVWGCTYAEFLQTDSYPFHALQFFPVGCLDALFCLSLISESVQPIMSANYF